MDIAGAQPSVAATDPADAELGASACTHKQSRMLATGFLVDRAAAEAIVAGRGVELVHWTRDRALLLLTVTEHTMHGLGPFAEATLAFVVRHPGAKQRARWLPTARDVLGGELAVDSFWHVANTDTAVAALSERWGMALERGQINVEERGKLLHAEVSLGGQRMLALAVRPGRAVNLGRRKLSLLGHRPDVILAARWAGGWDRAQLSAGGAELELGPHPDTELLRRLGVPPARRGLVPCLLERGRCSIGLFAAVIDDLDGVMGLPEHFARPEG